MKKRCSAIVAQRTEEQLALCAEQFDFDYQTLRNFARECAKKRDYAAYARFTVSLVEQIGSDIVDVTPEAAYRFAMLLDNLFITFNATHFVLSEASCRALCVDNPLTSASDRLIDFDALETLGDWFLDFSADDGYTDLTLKVCFTDYKVTTKKCSGSRVCNVSLLKFSGEVSKCLYSFSLVEGLTDKVLIDAEVLHVNGMCAHCKQSSYVDCHFGNSVMEQRCKPCLVSCSKVQHGNCALLGQAITLPQVLKVIHHVVYMFANRKNVNRRNGKVSKVYAKHKVYTVVESDNEEQLLDLHQFYRYEQKHGDWKGGHHVSPAAHMRRAHSRIIRNPDGTVKKIVPVRATMVNSDNEKKAVYRV